MQSASFEPHSSQALRLAGFSSQPDPRPGYGRVVAHPWWWEAQFSRAGFTTANEIHIPVGTDLAFRIESADVIHDFRVPQPARKMDAIPGHSKSRDRSRSEWYSTSNPLFISRD